MTFQKKRGQGWSVLWRLFCCRFARCASKTAWPSAWDTRRWPRKTWPRQHLSPGKMKSRRQQKSPVRRSLKPSGWWTQTNAENWREFCLHKRFTFAKQQKPQWGFWVTERSCASKMEGPCPDKWLFMQRKAGCANLAQKSPWFGQMCKRCAESVQPLSYIKKERQILRFDVQYLVHLQGLEPWAHWLREQAAGSSQFMDVSSHRYF